MRCSMPEQGAAARAPPPCTACSPQRTSCPSWCRSKEAAACWQVRQRSDVRICAQAQAHAYTQNAHICTRTHTHARTRTQYADKLCIVPCGLPYLLCLLGVSCLACALCFCSPSCGWGLAPVPRQGSHTPLCAHKARAPPHVRAARAPVLCVLSMPAPRAADPHTHVTHSLIHSLTHSLTAHVLPLPAHVPQVGPPLRTAPRGATWLRPLHAPAQLQGLLPPQCLQVSRRLLAHWATLLSPFFAV